MDKESTPRTKGCLKFCHVRTGALPGTGFRWKNCSKRSHLEYPILRFLDYTWLLSVNGWNNSKPPGSKPPMRGKLTTSIVIKTTAVPPRKTRGQNLSCGTIASGVRQKKGLPGTHRRAPAEKSLLDPLQGWHPTGRQVAVLQTDPVPCEPRAASRESSTRRLGDSITRPKHTRVWGSTDRGGGGLLRFLVSSLKGRTRRQRARQGAIALATGGEQIQIWGLYYSLELWFNYGSKDYIGLCKTIRITPSEQGESVLGALRYPQTSES